MAVFFYIKKTPEDPGLEFTAKMVLHGDLSSAARLARLWASNDWLTRNSD